MDLGAAMDDLGSALETIDGLRVFPYWADKIHPPAAVVGWPNPYDFDSTMVRGSDRASFPVTVLAGKVDARTSRDTLSVFCDGSGDSSVKQAVEGYAATAYDTARVQSIEFSVIPVAGVEYLAATFDIDVVAPGAS